MTDEHRPAPPPVAIVGIGAVMPGATGVDGFWRGLLEGRDEVGEVPASRWLLSDHHDPDPAAPDKTYCDRGAFLPQVAFDPLHFGIPPANLPATDTAQLLGLVVAEQVLADLAAGRSDPIDTERTSVLLGNSGVPLGTELSTRLTRPVLLKVLRERGVAEPEAQAICDALADHVPQVQEASFPGGLSNVIAGRIANRFDLHGTNCTLDAACASSLAALATGVDELALGRSDLVLTGGVDTLNDPMSFLFFSKTPALSPNGSCRPFDASADGTVLGEGVALFALKRLADAERDHDRIYSVIRGIGSSSDGRNTSIYGPLAEGQQLALRRAYEAAGYGPDTVGMVEAHGTGTVSGDQAELTALRSVYGAADPDRRSWCAVGSVKSQIGHTKAAAGAAGLLKATLALHHKVLPPTIGVTEPAGTFQPDDPFYLNTVARPWLHDAEHPRRAAVSSFGFGGTNFHLTLEEYSHSDAVERCSARPAELLLLSAATADELLRQCSEVVDELRAGADAHQLQRFQTQDPCRLAVIADAGDLAGQLDTAAEFVRTSPETGVHSPRGIHYGTGRPQPGRIAFLFPGQGAQYPGMGADLAVHFPAAHETWGDLADLSTVAFPPAAFTADDEQDQRTTLAATEHAQPAIAAHSLSLLELLEMFGVRPDCVAGHSLGELLALHAAGVFRPRSLTRLARTRGELMRDKGAPGGMLVVAAGHDATTHMIEACGADELWVANHNAPEQTVVSGTPESLSTLEEHAASLEVRVQRPATSAGFHSPLMDSAVSPLREALADTPTTAPLLDVYGNADAALYPVEPEAIRHALAEQVTAPVRFAETIEAMYADGVRTFVEVGPSALLTGLVGQILHDRPHHRVPTDHPQRHGVTSLLDSLGKLATLGVPVVPEALYAHDRPARAHRPQQPEAQVPIDGGNTGRKYPPEAGADALPAPNPVDLREQPQPAGASTGVTAGASADAVDGQAAAPAVNSSVVESMLELQRQTAQAHAAYLASAEKALNVLASTGGSAPADLGEVGTPSPAPLHPGEAQPQPAQPQPAQQYPPRPAPAQPMPESAPMPAPPPQSPPATSASQASELTPDGPPQPESTVATTQGRDESADSLQTVLAVVSNKTGYPVGMLSPDLELEADLGLDSITRAQIMAELRDSHPNLEQLTAMVDPATVRTLADVSSLLQRATAPKLTRQVTTTLPAPASGTPMCGLDEAPLVVLDGGSGLADRVTSRLAERGRTAEVRDTAPEGASVVFLGGMAEVTGPNDAFAIQRSAFSAARAAASHNGPGVFVTVQDTGGFFGPCPAERCWLGGIAAAARTVEHERSGATTKAIDCAHGDRDTDAVATAIVAELTSGGNSADVGLAADGTRHVLDLADAPAATRRSPELGADSVILVSGGGRGITATVVRSLAQQYRARFVLLGRTALRDESPEIAAASTETELLSMLSDQNPDATPAECRALAGEVLAAREIRRTMDAVQHAGATAHYLNVDVRDDSAVRAAVHQARTTWGPVHALVHGAGLPSKERLADKTDEQFDRVFDTKTTGLAALLEATASDPLRLLCAFSSVFGRFGYPGQGDYGMANATVDQVLATEARRRDDCVVRCMQWGPWEGGMVTSAFAERLRAEEISLIDPEVGAEAFLAELGTDAGDPRVLLTNGTHAEVASVR